MRKVSQFYPERGLVMDFNSKELVNAPTTAAKTLLDSDSGSLNLFNAAAGVTFTLPSLTADLLGCWYDFLATVSATSNGHKVITGKAADFLMGGYTNVDTDTTNAVAAFTGDGSTHISVNMTAAGTNAKGGLIGTKLRFTAATTALWMVEGIVQGAGTVTTAFSTT